MALLPVALPLSLALPLCASARLPEGVPDLLAPQAAFEWHAVHVGDVHGDADLPVLLVTNTRGHEPAAMLIGLDARNGTEAYALESDPVIFVALLADPQTITTLYYDTGFAAAEQPSGQFRRIAHPAPGELPDFVRSIVPSTPRHGPTAWSDPPREGRRGGPINLLLLPPPPAHRSSRPPPLPSLGSCRKKQTPCGDPGQTGNSSSMVRS
jgi:hypothetical protein